MRLPTKPSHTPTSTGTLPSVRPSFMVVAITSLALDLAAHHLQQAHDIRRAEEVRADDVRRPPRRGGDLVDIEGRGVGRQDGARLAQAVELAEHRLLDVHLLEHRLDDDVRLAHGGQVERSLDQRHPCVHRRLLQPALGDGRRVVPADDRRGRASAPPATSRRAGPECLNWRSTWRCRRPSCRRR